MKNKKIKIALIVAVVAWLGLFVTDIVRVNNFEKPVFCVLVNGADDGGSGTYVGLGYTVDIEGNFVAEDEAERGVTEFDMKLLGLIRVAAGIRCLASDDSTVYSQADIEAAMNIVTDYFIEEFEGCEMKELWYDEAISLKQAEKWAWQYDAKEAIVLMSNFYVDESCDDGSLNPDYTYTDWNWILVRDDGEWELKTWGY